MKMFTRYSRLNLGSSIIIFLVGCSAFYFVLDHVLTQEINQVLNSEKEEITHFVKTHNSLPEITNTRDQQVYFSQAELPVEQKLVSKKAWNQRQAKLEWIRELVFGIEVNGLHYKVTVDKSQDQKNSFLNLIALIATGMIGLSLLTTLIINRIVLNKLWQPFYQSIDQISNYQLNGNGQLNLPKTNITEFNLLNNCVDAMVTHVEQDFQALKQFTGNAAHEMQTPLAVIAVNTESLIQDEALLEVHGSTISSIENAAKKLSRLNQSLLLLTKIESDRFALNEKVEWDVLVQQRLDELQDLIVLKDLSIELKTVPVSSTFHNQLAEILISNLVGNAIRYNKERGRIVLQLDSSELIISNTSGLPALDKTKIFDRFYRHPETREDGNGLGLSIVKQICEMSGYALDYQYANSMHVFSVRFPGK
ncbi:MAG: HAMP domain-containing sensor histidine kinase [Ferruginibacter sp.]|nr:HAMP domain-containing sensor histidine kinase [Ferruginibacter sp.]